MRYRRFRAVLVARNREFLRDRGFLAWTILFPVLIVFGFAFAFSDTARDRYKVGVIGEQGGHAFFETRFIDFITVQSELEARRKVERHQLHLLVDPLKRRYWVNPDSADGFVVEGLLRAAENELPLSFARAEISGEEVRYVDWLLPGLLCMNMMFAALWGVGFVIVRYRKNGVLRRLKATPLTAFEFIAAQLVSRLSIVLVVTVAIFVGCYWIIGFQMNGSWLSLLGVFALGTVSLIAMGLVIAARTSNEELTSGLLNLLSWPMMFLSGVWFSTEGFHPWVEVLAALFPLTHVIDACRAIMIDGAGLFDVWLQLIVLGGVSAVFLAVGSLAFRWES